MAPGRPGRIPRLTQILGDRGEPMTVAEVVKAWNLIGEDDSSYPFVTREQIGPSLARAALNSRNTGIVRIRRGVYEYDPYPAKTSTQKVADAKAASLKRHPAGRRLTTAGAYAESAIAETDRLIREDMPHGVKFVLDIVGEMKDGSLLLKDARSGKVWVAKEI